jgi:NAD(P)-dependent dehydrogenase (short-subunit alcohol dehydrogenase family)
VKQVALLTGAAGGIGRPAVEAFAADGWNTIAVDRRESGCFSPSIAFQQVDVSSPADMDALFAWLGGH